ncbi:hypothetical protein ACJW30_09G014900 [Castanea mollissima]
MSTCGLCRHLPTPLDASSEPPPFFDGTSRLYVSLECPYSQRVLIATRYKGLDGIIKLVPINIRNRPDWYKERVYPENKVPSLEHHGEVIGESLVLIRYLDSNFEGPSLLPDDPAKKEFADELITYSPAFDYLEKALHKFNDGPFFLGHELSLADITYAPFVENFQAVLSELWNYDITAGRPKLARWIEAVNQIDAYESTKTDPKVTIETFLRLVFASVVLADNPII